MGEQTYQLLPPLSAEEYAALKADIAEHGIRVPVDVDENGTVLDGHHRAAIAAELGIPYPTRVVAGLTEQGKAEHALTVNVARRQLSQAQRRDLIRSEVDRDPSRSDRAIARIVGVDHKTVGAVRRGEIPHLPEKPAITREEAERVTHRLRRDLHSMAYGYLRHAAAAGPDVRLVLLEGIQNNWREMSARRPETDPECLGYLRSVLLDSFTDMVMHPERFDVQGIGEVVQAGGCGHWCTRPCPYQDGAA